MRHNDLVVVQSFGTQVEADIAKGVLESAGIDAMIQADRAGGMRDHLAWSGFGFKVLVRDEDASAAHELLESASVDTTLRGEGVAASGFRTETEAESAIAALTSGVTYSAQQPGTP